MFWGNSVFDFLNVNPCFFNSFKIVFLLFRGKSDGRREKGKNFVPFLSLWSFFKNVTVVLERWVSPR